LIYGALQPCSLIDFPGKPAAVIFTQGCNFRCPFCHNPSLVLPERFSAPLAEKRVMDFLMRRRGKIEGIVISGGEPTIHDDLIQVFLRIRTLGFSVKLDTNGSRPEMLEAILLAECVDYIAMDVKAPPERHALSTGSAIPFSIIEKSIALLAGSAVPHEFRTTLHPGLKQPEDIAAIAALLPADSIHRLQNFVEAPEMVGRPAAI